MAASKLMEKYPFINELWKSDNFDEPIDINEDNLQIVILCNDKETYKTNPTDNYKTVCNNLLKNLKLLSNSRYSNIDTFITGCKNLNNWLYLKEIELNVSSDIINKIFQAYKQIKKRIYHSNECEYSTFDKRFNENEKLINLRIFNDNADTFQGMLKGEIKSDDCSLKRYVYKCIELYREMNSKYCSRGDDTKHENQNSCNIIRQFNSLYTSYIYKQNGILHEFPELSSNAPTDTINGCPPEVNELDQASPVPKNQTDHSIIQSVPPALGVMAGIPPFLALIYNFTPVRKFLSFRNKKTSRAFSNLGEEVENELIIQQFEDTKINSVHPKYNVAYGQI